MRRYGIWFIVGGLVLWGSYSMLHRHTYGTIDRHLEPGREYFMAPTYDARFLFQEYLRDPPVFAMDVEGDEEIYIEVVNEHQKVDHGVAYKRKRVPYTVRDDEKGFLNNASNGIHFFAVQGYDHLAQEVTVDEAVRLPAYIKVETFDKLVISVQMIRRVKEARNWFSYWPVIGTSRENSGYSVAGGHRDSWDECSPWLVGGWGPCVSRGAFKP
jgi:hypothetical protein